ncbi:hypothetical protein [Microcystis sp.]|uniref:hypothetical protein n=1 Tax=Microcystis sp. TaxID=1127 RepID=UPI00391EF727
MKSLIVLLTIIIYREKKYNEPHHINTHYTITDGYVIVISSGVFGGLTTIGCTLNPLLFSATENGTAKIIYSVVGGVGTLSFDQDLSNIGGLVTIANIAGLNAATLNASNIQVIA